MFTIMDITKRLWIFPLLMLSLFFFACEKDKDNHAPPSISFKTGEAFTPNEALVEVGGKLYFGIQARANGANLTNFTVKKHLNSGEIITVMDTGLNASVLNIGKLFYQNVEDTAKWVFTIMDRNRLSSNVSMILYRDPNSSFGGIYDFKSVVMGYQENLEFGHFCDPSTGKVYFEDSATLMQDRIDFLVYYIVDDDKPSPVFSSPGEMDNFSTEALAFYPVIKDWERNYTLWDISVEDDPISESAFSGCHNDSLLIVSFDEIWGKKKFKWACDGLIIPFMTKAGKKGLVKVNQADLTADGLINFDIKIQQ
jgi:hypothetical protein